MKNFSGANFCFWASVLVVCFWCFFAFVFALFFDFSFPKMSRKILLMSGLSFLGFFSLFLWFFRRRRRLFFFLREKAQVVTGHTPTRTCVVCHCSFCCPAALVCSPFFFLVFPWGAILGPTRFWDSPGTLLRPFFWTRGGKGVLVVSFCCFCFPLLLCFATLFTATRRGGPVVVRGIPPGRRTRPAPE